MILNDITTLTYIALAGCSIAVISLIISIVTHFNTKKVLRGASKDLGASVTQLVTDMKGFDVFRKDIEKYLCAVESRLKTSLRGMHTIRFNPFQGDGSGGFQSFATAFLNEEGTGVIISSLHARDRMSVYAKPIVKFVSEFELTEEEQEALSKAKESCKLS
jgi:hypothetical protein